MEEKEQKNSDAIREEIFRLGEVTTGAPGAEIKCISVIGQIEGHICWATTRKPRNTNT